MDLWTATENSVNVVFAQLALDVGAERHRGAAHRMGITSALDAVPSITLGVEEVSTSTWPRRTRHSRTTGVHCEPYAVGRGVPKTAPNGIGVHNLYRHGRSASR